MGFLVLILVIIGIVIFAKKANQQTGSYSNETGNYADSSNNNSANKSARPPKYNFTPSTVIKDTEGNVIVNKSADELFEIGRSIYFTNPDNPSLDDIEKAAPYFEAAAQKGNLHGVKMAKNCRSILAFTSFTSINAVKEFPFFVNQDFWKDNLHDLQMANYWSNDILSSKSGYFPIEDRENAQNSYDLTLYPLGVALYIFDKYEEAAAILSEAIELGNTAGNQDLKAKVLYGICLWEYAKKGYDISMIREAVQNLKILHDNRTYAKSKKKNFEEFIYALSAHQLSVMYRAGIESIINKDMTKAYEVLVQALENITIEELKTSIVEELDHFRKLPNGSYTYIG